MDFKTLDIIDAVEDDLDLHKTTEVGNYSRIFIPDEISEINLFCLLLWKFKHPNGQMSLALGFHGDPNAPFKWDFMFKTPENISVRVIRSVRSLEFLITERGISESDVVTFIENNFAKHAKEIQETKSLLGNFSLIVNPYDRHKNMSDLAEDELKKITLEKPYTSKDPLCTRTEINQLSKAYSQYFQDSDREAFFSMLLVTESAFTVEAYINLMHAVFMKDEVFNNTNIYQETLKKPWRNKIERMPITCNHIIAKNINLKDEIITDMQYLFNLRNKIAHSYPAENDLGVGQMWFFKSFPILENPVPYFNYQLALNNRLPTREESLKSKDISHTAVDYLRNIIDIKYRDYFENLANSSPLAYCKNGRIYMIPFGNQIILSVGLIDENN